MKNRYRIYGTVQVDVMVEIEAHSLEEAMDYAWDNYRMEEYCNGTIGCEDGGYEFDDAELTCSPDPRRGGRPRDLHQRREGQGAL